jgi:hypothetical protein
MAQVVQQGMELLASILCLLLAGCLGAKTTCLADSDCNSGRVCVASMCVDPANACPPVENHTLWVDPAAVDGQSGSTPGCALRLLSEALTRVDTSSTWTVVVRGGTAGPVAVPRRIVPAGVFISGGTIGTGSGRASSFAACTDNVACPITRWAQLDIPSTDDSGIEFSASGPGGLRYFSLLGPPPTGTPQMPASTVAGIYIANTGSAPVTLDHLRIKQFRYGILADPAGNVEIDEDVQSSENLYGLYAQSGSTVAIKVGAGRIETEFNHNFSDGIHLEDGVSSFTVQGPPAPSPAALTPGVGASLNGGHGVLCGLTTARIDGLNAQRNQGSGIVVTAGSSLVLRNSRVFDNQLDGVRITTGSGTVATIDLGQAPSGDGAGGNGIYGNGATNLCVEKEVADAQAPGSLRALGNDFTNYDQPTPIPKSCAVDNTLSGGQLCRGGVDVSDDLTQVVNVGACTID